MEHTYFTELHLVLVATQKEETTDNSVISILAVGPVKSLGPFPKIAQIGFSFWKDLGSH